MSLAVSAYFSHTFLLASAHPNQSGSAFPRRISNDKRGDLASDEGWIDNHKIKGVVELRGYALWLDKIVELKSKQSVDERMNLEAGSLQNLGVVGART